MYFSMQFVTHEDSELEREEPGVETHFSKQLDLRFCACCGQSMCLQVSGLWEIEVPHPATATGRARRTFMSFWAFATDDSVRTCWITAFFTAVESMFLAGELGDGW